MYTDKNNEIREKVDLVRTILLKWKNSIKISNEGKEELFQCVVTMLSIKYKRGNILKITTPTLIKRALNKSYNSIYTLYMHTSDEIFKFVSMLLNEDKDKVPLAFVTTYVYGFSNLQDYDFSVTFEKWLKNIAVDVVKKIC